jgi:hypothetical protein
MMIKALFSNELAGKTFQNSNPHAIAENVEPVAKRTKNGYSQVPSSLF